VAAHDKEALRKKAEQNGNKLVFKLNGETVELVYNEDFYSSVGDQVKTHQESKN
jgi:hypothetical protein